MKLVELSDFDVNKPLVIFLHGFLESSSGESSTTVSKAILEDANLNVLALDSSSILSFIYFKASTCVRFIGKQLAEVLAELVTCTYFNYLNWIILSNLDVNYTYF